MPDEAEKKLESSSESQSSKVSDTVVKEADKGKPELVEKQKEQSNYLKLGGTSGITNEFGKPLYMISENETGKQSADKSTLDSIQSQIADIGKPREANINFDNSIAKPADAGVATKPADGSAIKPADFINSNQADSIAAKPADSSAADPAESIAAKPADSSIAKQADGSSAKPADSTAPAAKDAGTYYGEDLNKDIEPGYHTAKKGETLTSIARDHLGPGATPDDIKKYTTEIAKQNGMDPNKPGNFEGKELSLPGNTKDGGYISQTDYYKKTVWKDGSAKTERWDGRTSERHPTGDGGYTEKHTGPRPEDNYGLEKTKDGKFLIADKPGDKPVEVTPGSEDVRVERSKLEQLAETKIKDPEKLAKFHADMLRFEERAGKQDPPLSPKEIADTYKQEQRLMNATGDSPLKEGDRIKLAEQVMSQAATPTSIDQGQHNSCSVATVESRTYTRSPAEAARLVTDVATTGKYTTPDGTVVNVDPKDIPARDQEAQNNPPNDGDRSHASQIFQVTAVNSYYQTHGFDYKDANGVDHHVPPGKLKYEQNEVKPGTNPPETGERLVDTSTTPPTTIMSDWKNNTPMRGPELKDGAIAETSDKISGKNDTVYLGHDKAVDGDKSKITTFENEEQMKEALAKAKAEHKMPVIMRVHTGEEPFLHDSGDGKAGGSGGWHVVTITDYDEKTGRAKIDNQWGSKVDHASGNEVSSHDLFMSSRAPDYKETTFGFTTGGTEHDLKKDVEYDRKHNSVDTRKELELIRIEHKNGELSDKDYNEQLKKTMDDANERWAKQKADGTFNQSEHDNAVEKVKDMTAAIPPEQRLDILQKQYQRNFMNSCEYDDAMVKSFRDFSAKTPAPGTEEKKAFAEKYKEMLNNLPEDRRQEILERCK